LRIEVLKKLANPRSTYIDDPSRVPIVREGNTISKRTFLHRIIIS